MMSVTVNDIFHREVSIEENEDFAQLRVILRLVLAASDFFVATPTVILENTTRLSRTWLGQGVPDILWLDDHKTVGLRLCPHEKQVPAPVAGATYYDIDVEGRSSHPYTAVRNSQPDRSASAYDALFSGGR